MNKIVELNYLKFRHPFTCICSGPTGSGKTILIRRILSNWRNNILITNKSNDDKLNVYWVYGQFQELYNSKVDNVEITYSSFLPSSSELKQDNIDIIIIDDLMDEMSNNERMSKLFTKESHHLNLSVVFVVQNFFHQSKQMRNISLNSQYIILMNNVRDQNQIEFLGRQLFRDKLKAFKNAYKDAVSKVFGYLVIDLKPDTPNKYRLKTRLTTEELPPSILSKTNFSPYYYILY